MQLERLRTFERMLSEYGPFVEQVMSHTLFYEYEDTWYRFDGDSKAESKKFLIEKLYRTVSKGEPWRATSSQTSWFPLKAFQGVVQCRFASPTQKNKRERIFEHIETCVTNSTNEFDATHDGATGLLNTEAFKRMVEAELGKMIDSSDGALDSPATTANRGVAIVALDIDDFKQVNDTYGHNYGDLVIKCLGRRLQNSASEFEREAKEPVRLSVARPGGEEFLVCISGEINESLVLKFAEEIRTKICNIALPNDDELEIEGVDPTDAPFTLPSWRERYVSASVGVSSILRHFEDDANRTILGLREECDAALSIAKKSGKNIVRLFSRILERFGTVIEHHEDTNVVAIDIGKFVNVRPGQEFRVVHPKFTGDFPFTVSDGRTTRNIGVYPESNIGQVEVFDVQNEVSFCNVANTREGVVFPVGSRLYAIPLGSIGHLLQPGINPGFSASSALLSSIEFTERIKARAGEQAGVRIGVFKIIDEELLHQRLGTALINKALASLHDCIRDRFGSAAGMSLTENTEFSILIPDDFVDGDMETALTDVTEAAARLCKDRVTFATGAYSSENTAPNNIQGDNSSLKHSSGLEYARYAALLACGKKRPFELFTPKTASDFLYMLRKVGAYEQALEDYKVFKELGIDNGFVENQAAICEHNAVDWQFERTMEKANRAVELLPSWSIIRANRAGYYWTNHSYKDVVEEYLNVQSEFPEDDMQEAFAGIYAMSLGELHEIDPDSYPLDHVESEVRRVIAEVESALSTTRLGQLKELLDKLSLRNSEDPASESSEP